MDAWTGPNYWKHSETPTNDLGLWHYGEVNIQPAYIDGGYRYAQAWFTFTDGANGTQSYYTPMGYGPTDTRYLNNYTWYRDIWSWDTTIPKVRFDALAVKVPQNSNSWPVY